MDCPRHLPAVLLTMLILTVMALAAGGVPLPAWPAAIAVAELLACGMTFLASACLDLVRAATALLRAAGRHARGAASR